MTEIMPVPRNLILLSYQQGAFVVSFFLDVAPFGISMPCRSKPSLRNCLVLRTCEFTAHQRRRSEDRSDISIAQILTVPSTSEQVLYRLLRLIL